MRSLPAHSIAVYGGEDALPSEAEALFEGQLAHSRRVIAEQREDSPSWRYSLICAVTPAQHILGGVHLDIGPIGGGGPLALESLAYIERTIVRTPYRRKGLATRLLQTAVDVARDAGCLYLRCSNNWDNEAERRLFVKCGFALVDLNDETDDDPCYLAVRPVCGLS